MMTAVWLAGLLFGFQVFDAEEQASDTLKELDRILVELNELSQGVKAGDLPSLEDLSLARTTRHQVLRQFNPQAVASLSYTPEQLRARILPGFSAELRLLSDLEPGNAPLPEPSPLLVQLLDLEEEMGREAFKQLYRMGLQNPLEVGALSASAVAPDFDPGELSANSSAEPVMEPTEEELSEDPLLRAESLFAAGKFEAALTEYRKLELERNEENLPTIYRIAECLLKAGHTVEARDEFRAISEEFKETTWGQNAEWSADYAEVLSALGNQGGSRG